MKKILPVFLCIGLLLLTACNMPTATAAPTEKPPSTPDIPYGTVTLKISATQDQSQAEGYQAGVTALLWIGSPNPEKLRSTLFTISTEKGPTYLYPYITTSLIGFAQEDFDHATVAVGDIACEGNGRQIVCPESIWNK